MANLFKKRIVVTDPKTGEKIVTTSRKWWGRYKNELGIEKRVPLASDKTGAQTMLTELVRKVELRAAGVIDRYDEHRKTPIGAHVNDFVKYLEDKRNSSEHVKLVEFRVRTIIEHCKVRFISDLSASGVQSCLADLRANSHKIVQTSNH
jgi:hypothetical protein